MKVRILGSGTSSGVPRIGPDWGACDPAEPKNDRRRASILVSADDTHILVDTGPDLRAQLLDARVHRLDAVFWTHEHADHTHGIDDLRQLFFLTNQPMAGYASPRCLADLRARFSFVFDGAWGYPGIVSASSLEGSVVIGPIKITPVEQPHGDITSTGLRFDGDGKSIVYSTDFKDLTPQMEVAFEDSDLWIVDAVRRRPHPTHCHLDAAIAFAARLRVRRAILTHMDNSMDYATLLAQLPPHIEPGYDGMEIEP